MVKHRISGISAFLAMLLFPTAYWICEFFYPSMDDIDSWRLMRDCGYSLEILLLILSCIFPKNKLTVASLYGLIFLVLGDLVDRIFFKTYHFDETDWPLIAMVIIVFFYKLRHKKNESPTR